MHRQVWKDEDRGLQAYYSDIARTQPLSREEESALAGDIGARDQLARANLRFVISVAKQYQNRGLTLAELIGAGNMGLLTAVDRFDPERGFKFISYAVWWIRQAILQSLAEDVRTVHLPLNRVNLLQKISKVSQQLSERRGEAPDEEEVAAALDVPVKEIHQTLLSGHRAYSLDRESEEERENGLMKTLADDRFEAPDANILRAANQEMVETLLDRLEERELRIIRLYFGLDGDEPQNLEQIGNLLGVTRERIRQIKERALGKLRHPACRAAAQGLKGNL